MLIDQSAEPLGVLQSLRQLGISLAIDDFGTGYSSLSYLHRFPVDILKVDRSFIQLLGTTQEPGLARSIVRIGDELGLRTVAEGIEYDEQLAALQHLGCTLGQGYLFAAPMHEDEISAHLDGVGRARTGAVAGGDPADDDDAEAGRAGAVPGSGSDELVDAGRGQLVVIAAAGRGSKTHGVSGRA